MAKLFANSGDPDQMLHSVASDLGLHCLPFTRYRVSRLQWSNAQLLSCLQENPDSDCVRVCVRCRPINEKEIQQGCTQVVQVSDFIQLYGLCHVKLCLVDTCRHSCKTKHLKYQADMKK